MKQERVVRTIGIVIAVALTTPRAASGQEPAEPEISEAQIRRALVRYRREPPVERVVAAALRNQAASAARVHDAIDRARITGWLPIGRARIRRGQGIDLRSLVQNEGTSTTNVSTDDDLSFDASLLFRFDRAVFAPEEVPLLRELRAIDAQRAELASAIVHLYFERRRLQLERDLLGARGLTERLRIAEIEGLLNAFTGGAFARMIGAVPRESP